MKKIKILLIFALLFITVFVVSFFVNINGFVIKNVWFSEACVLISLYSFLYCIMFKLDSSFYYGTLLLGIGVASFIEWIYDYPFSFYYPIYLFCISVASFAVFAFFRQKIHFKLFAIFFFEAILLIVYKMKYLNIWQLLILNGLFLLIVIFNAIFRIKRNFKEN